jgi:cell fate (sporulation/competence/biofilm development) regulator YmcA (YheA/YmcA/DUF963 family)
MNDIESQIKRLKEALYSLPEVVAFYEARAAVMDDPELKELDIKKRQAQRAMAESMADDLAYQKHKVEYQALEAAYESHPLVGNYHALREAVYFLLTQIKDVLSLD